MGCGSTGLLVLIYTLMVSGVALLATAAITYDWIDDKSQDIRQGLWRSCAKDVCATRLKILHFTKASRDYDILLIVTIGSVLFALLVGIMLLCDLRRGAKTKRIQITSTMLLIPSALGGAFIVIYNEVELLDESTFERGWGTYVAYGGAGALVLACIFLFVRTVCFQTTDRDKSNTLMLRRASWRDPKYQPTHQYLHSINGIDNRAMKMPPPYTANVHVRQYSNWIDR